MNTPRNATKTTFAGFTLVEVILSLGILSFAMVALLGLIPLGLSTSRNAINITTESQIVQSLCNEIQLTDFSNISNTVLYYNEEGSIVNSSDQTILYSVVISSEKSISPATGLSTGSKTDSAQTVLIRVANKTTPKTTNSYSVIVFNNNQ
jgi:uncharacterized protein (TIGR02598 family)